MTNTTANSGGTPHGLRRRQRSAAGFTLIELLVVMLLVTILMAVAVPRFGTLTLQNPVKKTNRWITQTVRHLRTTALQKHKVQILMVDLNRQRLWTVAAEMSEEERLNAAATAFQLPAGMRIVNVQIPETERSADGTTAIHFYPAGYADMALIHIEIEGGERLSWVLEPLLPKVRRYEGWIR